MASCAVEVELTHALQVAEGIATHDIQRRIVSPLVWIADLVHHRVQLFFGLDFGFGAHPIERVDVLAHGLFDGERHFERLLLFRRREVFRDVHLAERLAHFAVDAAGAALPAFLLLLCAVQNVRVEVPGLRFEALGHAGAGVGSAAGASGDMS